MAVGDAGGALMPKTATQGWRSLVARATVITNNSSEIGRDAGSMLEAFYGSGLINFRFNQHAV